MKQAWKKLFKPWILERGYEYFDEQRVTDLEINSDHVTAYVMGSDDYFVSILLNKNEPTEIQYFLTILSGKPQLISCPWKRFVC